MGDRGHDRHGTTLVHNAVRGGPSHGHRYHTENFVKSGYAVFEICERKDRQINRQPDTQTYRHTITKITILRPDPGEGGEVPVMDSFLGFDTHT